MNVNRFQWGLAASWAGFIFILFVWEMIALFELINPAVFPGPVKVAESAVKNVPLSRLLQHIGASLMRVGIGFGLGLVVGVSVGVAVGWYRNLADVLTTPIEIIRPIPPLAWIPLFIIWLGIGEASKIAIIFLGAFFPIYTNTFKGMVNVDVNLIKAGQVMGLKGRRILFRVMVPATLPDIATGMRLGWSYSFGIMVAAELIAANSGLGYMIMHARELGLISVIMYGVILIGTINLITDYFIQEVILKHQLRWHFQMTRR
ncbi:MAG: ABC transporter permease [Spirochaetota bacterium]